RFHLADGLVGETEMDTRNPLVVAQRREQALPQCLAHLRTVAFADVEALREHVPALADTVRVDHTADRARYVAERRHDATLPFGRRIQSVQIILPAEHLRSVGLVEIEVLRRAGEGKIAAAAAKSWN